MRESYECRYRLQHTITTRRSAIAEKPRDVPYYSGGSTIAADARAAFRPIEVSHNNTSKVQSRHTDVYTIILYFITRHMLVSQGTKFAFCSVFLVVTDISATVRGTDRGEILHDGTWVPDVLSPYGGGEFPEGSHKSEICPPPYGGYCVLPTHLY